jgi:hypothetical protein
VNDAHAAETTDDIARPSSHRGWALRRFPAGVELAEHLDAGRLDAGASRVVTTKERNDE